MINDNIKQFCQQHRINVLDTNKRASQYHKVNINYFRYPMDYNRVYQDIVVDSEPLYTVEIAESELEKINRLNNLQQNSNFLFSCLFSFLFIIIYFIHKVFVLQDRRITMNAK